MVPGLTIVRVRLDGAPEDVEGFLLVVPVLEEELREVGVGAGRPWIARDRAPVVGRRLVPTVEPLERVAEQPMALRIVRLEREGFTVVRLGLGPLVLLPRVPG